MSEPDTCDGCTGRVRGEDHCACQKAAIARGEPDEPFWKRARMPGYQAETDRLHARPEGVIVVRPLTPAEWDAYMEARARGGAP